MKNISKILFTLACMVFLGVSCTNEPVELTKKTTITISPSDVLEEYTGYSSTDLEMKEDDEYGLAKLRINAFLYDENGNLVLKQEGLVSDYTESYTFEVQLNTSKSYTLVSFSNSIFGSLHNPKLEAYEFSGEANLSTLTVTQVDARSYYSNWSVLGGSKDVINVEEDNDVRIKHESITSMVYLLFSDIHANSGSDASDIYGEYTTSASNYWGTKDFEWTISVEPGESDDEVIINGLCPVFTQAGAGTNSFKGILSEDMYIIIPKGQSMGFTDDEGEVCMWGVEQDEEGNLVGYEDIYIYFENDKLVFLNMFGACVENTDNGWYSLFNRYLEFTRTSSGVGVDSYVIIYHNNDYLEYDANADEFVFGTTLESNSNNGYILSPADNPDSRNIYSLINLLPGEYDSYSRIVVGNEMTDFSQQEIVIESGHQYLLELDCSTMNLSFTEEVMKSKAVNLYAPARTKLFGKSLPLYPAPKQIIL